MLSRDIPKLAPCKVAAGRRKGALEPVVDLSITNTDSEEVKTRSALEDEFNVFIRTLSVSGILVIPRMVLGGTDGMKTLGQM